MNASDFKRIVLPLEPAMHRVAYGLLGSEQDALDALQEAWVMLWQGRGALAEVENLEAYCVTVVKRRAIAMLRQRRTVPLGEWHAELLEEEEDLMAQVEARLGELSETQREAIRLKYFEGHENEEIARRMSITEVNLRQHLSRGIRKLKQLINHGEQDR